MIILLKNNADEKQVGNLKNWLRSMGFDIHLSVGQSQTIMGLIGDTSRLDIDVIKSLEIVDCSDAEGGMLAPEDIFAKIKKLVDSRL